MKADERRTEIFRLIQKSQKPLSGSAIAREMGVSRQIVVSDIAKLKERGADIIATYQGYILYTPPRPTREFKLVHTDDEIEDELCTIIELGGRVLDVFVWHKIYGKIEAKLDIFTKENVAEYLESLRTGRSSALKNLTSGYHYHTVEAKNEEILDRIGEELDRKGYLVLQ